MKKVIHTDDAPEAIGTYSQAVLADKFLFISGQIGLDPATMELVEGFEEETIQVFRNISAICEEAGCSINDVIKFNVLLTYLSETAQDHVLRVPNNRYYHMDSIGIDIII